MLLMDWLEWIGSGVEMAWDSLQHDHALHWSATGLLDALVEVLVAFMVLVCTILNFFTSSFIRVSGFHIPCSCCVHFRKDSSVIAGEASKIPSILLALKSIDAPVESEVRLNCIDQINEYLRVGELRSTDSPPLHALRVSIPCESPLEVLAEREGADSEYASDLQYEQVNTDLNDRTQEDAAREQYAKVQELLRALQLERGTMATLYSELEEERNSSATAASEALAMISRLQEEKAAIQMESWQFQRMVMEKAMYDQEAIEVLKEILAKQEEERIELEEEVRLYKERLDDVLMEERDYAEKAGRDYVPMHLLQGTSTDGNSTSPKSERAEPLVSERITPNGRILKDEIITPDGGISKDDRVAPNGRISKDVRITPDGRFVKEEKITPNGGISKDERVTPNGRISEDVRITPDGRLIKEEKITPNGRHSKEERTTPNGRLGKGEDAEFLDRLSKTKSQLLTALLQEGFPEPASAFVEDSASFAKEIQKAIAKIPMRAESLPILDHEHYKATLGLGAIRTGREIVLPIPPAVDKKQTEKASGKDAIRSTHEPVSISRERTPPTIAKEKTEQARAAKDDGEADEPVFASREIGLPVPPAAAKKQFEKALVAKDAGEFIHKPLIISREMSLPILPPTAPKKQKEKVLIKNDGIDADEPEFVSLKRRWSSRGSQEVSVETLAKAEDRRMEEKRMSVLEYVRNLEEQLQQQAGRPAAQLARARTVDGREDDVRFKSPGQFESSSISEMSVSSGGLERDESVQRRLFADGDAVDKELNMNSSQGAGDDKLYAQQHSFNTESDCKISNDEGAFYVNAGKPEESADEALFVHDVYEEMLS